MRLGALSIAAVLTASVGTVAAEKETVSSEATSRQPSVSLVAVGDILFGRYLRSTKNFRRVAKVEHPFEGVKEVIEGADIAFANLEAPVMDEPDKFSVYQTLTFRAELSDAAEMAAIGFDVVSIANNHTLNLGYYGAPLTRKNVADSGLDPCGAGADEQEATEAVIKEVNGIRVMFICYTVWTNGRNDKGKDGAVAYVRSSAAKKLMPPIIKKAREKHSPDFTVVSMHWGFEYEPKTRNGQKHAAHKMVEAGADLILGHHAHVLQEIETYKGAVIAYSLGNFMFDNAKQNQRDTLILEARFSGTGEDRSVDVTLHPVWIDRDKKKGSRPMLATGGAYRRIKKKLEKLAPGIAVAPDPGK